jgi:hypothetical protein
MSEGYVGRLQHLIGFQSRQLVPRTGAGGNSSDPSGIENDGCNGAGCTGGRNSTPLTIPLVANFTLLGPPDGITGTALGVGVMLRRGTGGFYVNGAVARWERSGLSLRDTATIARSLTATEFLTQNLHVADVGALWQAQTSAAVPQDSVPSVANSITYSTTHTKDTLFTSVPTNPTDTAQLNWTPRATGSAPLTTGGTGAFGGTLATKGGTYVTGTTYRGAVDPAGPQWWRGWTNYADN